MEPAEPLIVTDSGCTTPVCPAVSVVLPTYQRRELVRRAVASVLSQSFRDFELIVVDDGSTDGTQEALEGVDDRLRYVWQENAGVATARNRGLERARAPVIAFLDSDDRWLPDHLAVLTAVMERHPEAVLATTCPDFGLLGRDGPGRSAEHDLRDRLAAIRVKVGFSSCVGVRRAALVRVGHFDEGLRAAEDTDLWIRLGALGPIATVRRRTVVRHRSADSLCEESRLSGEYLAAAERRAANLLAAVERMPEAQRGTMLEQAKGEQHLARAMTALDRRDAEVVATELAGATRLLPASVIPGQVEYRTRHHLRRGHDLNARLEALCLLCDLWPEPRGDTARYLRAAAIASALRLRRPLQAVRLASGWRRQGNWGFVMRTAPVAHAQLRRVLQDRRNRAREASGCL